MSDNLAFTVARNMAILELSIIQNLPALSLAKLPDNVLYDVVFILSKVGGKVNLISHTSTILPPISPWSPNTLSKTRIEIPASPNMTFARAIDFTHSSTWFISGH